MRRPIIALAALALFGMPLRARAADAANPNHEAYLKLCSSCHGPEGKGNGALAPLLTPKPTDLTQLAKKNGGEFNALAVYQTISGPRLAPAHGTSEMPVWGEVLRQEPGGSDPRGTELTLAKIVNYLRSIQAK